jgi:hypothetical protein
MKKVIIYLLAIVSVQSAMTQSLEKMQWFNELEKWEVKNNQ